MPTDRDRPLRVYLAGPEVFLLDADEIGRKKKQLCEKYGFVGVFPFDLQVPSTGQEECGYQIAANNEHLIESSEILIANMTPLRGPSADVGTAYEMGFARAKGLPVFAYSNIAQDFQTRNHLKIAGMSNKIVEHDQNGMAIEAFGLVDNLMLDGAVHVRGSRVIVPQKLGELAIDGGAASADVFRSLSGFEQCLAEAQSIR